MGDPGTGLLGHRALFPLGMARNRVAYCKPATIAHIGYNQIPMSPNAQSCPIWHRPPHVKTEYDLPGVESIAYSSLRAGGPFLLMRDGAAQLNTTPLAERHKVNLSYLIYKHNLENRILDRLFDCLQELGLVLPHLEKYPKDWNRVFDCLREQDVKLLQVNETWVKDNQNNKLSAEDRMLMFLREVIRSDDAGEEPNGNLQKAAGGCRNDKDDLGEMVRHAMAKGWTGSLDPNSAATRTDRINFPARLHVEEKLREQGEGRQGFVAMWFDPRMDDAYKLGIKPAICTAGYEPMLIRNKEYLGDVTDEIVAEIRKSRFVVADFTTTKKAGARGGVYFEAGFARGLGIPVIHTCHKDRMKYVHFDTNHFNHLTWEKPEDLRRGLRKRIEAVLGRGPLNPPTEQGED